MNQFFNKKLFILSMWKLTLGYDNHIEYKWEHQISEVWNVSPPKEKT